MQADFGAEPDTVLADPAQMEQILMNLAANSAQAMQGSGGELRMSLEAVFFGPSDPLPVADMLPGGYVLLTVSDTGVGMTDAVRRRIFEPFFTTRKAGQGTGMGLAVVYGIVRAHGGAIAVESAPGKGASFRIYLPHIRAPETGKDADVESLPGGHERILFVDDEELLASTVRTTLERLGYEVTTVAAGMDAWRVFLGNPARFDLVITDQTMPGMTGTMLAEKILGLERRCRHPVHGPQRCSLTGEGGDARHQGVRGEAVRQGGTGEDHTPGARSRRSRKRAVATQIVNIIDKKQEAR